MTKIKITESIGPQEVSVFPGGVVKIVRGGLAFETTSPDKNVVIMPRMDERATLHITADRSTLAQNQISVTSESLRWLANFFNSAADHMDRPLIVPEDRPVYESVLLAEDDNGDWFYTGDLDDAVVLVRQDRETNIAVHADNHWTVDLLDDPDSDSVAEYGNGRTEEEAWRYALGAYFGPADAEYDEHRLLRALACGNWNSEPPVLPPAVERVEKPRLTVGSEGEPVVSDGLVPDENDGSDPGPEDGSTHYMSID